MLVTVTLNPAVDKNCKIDNFKPGEVNRISEHSESAAGKGINASKAAVILGEKSIALGFIAGTNGKFIENSLIKNNIKCDFIEVNGNVRTNMTILDKHNNMVTEITEPGFNITENDIKKLEERIYQYAKLSPYILFAGSIPAGCPDDIYARLIETARNAGTIPILDASGSALIKGVNAKPFMIKPNQDEIKQLLNIEIENNGQLIDSAVKLYNSGIKLVIVSLGKKGALCVSKEGVYIADSPYVPVINTVGCGDTMVACFLIGLIHKWDMKKTLSLAIAASSANCMTEYPAYFKLSDVNNILEKVQVKQIK